MPANAPDFTFTYHPLQRERFRDGSLAVEWSQRYPELFDEDDARILKTTHQRKYHFFEWLSAILLYEATGYLSLIEGYTTKTHARKRNVLRDVVGAEMFGWLVGHQSGQPDLFVYHPRVASGSYAKLKEDQMVCGKTKRPGWQPSKHSCSHRALPAAGYRSSTFGKPVPDKSLQPTPASSLRYSPGAAELNR